jgi:preprotein translocase subunit SecG
MYQFFLVVHAIIAAALVGVILMQRSEGGGLAGGGSPAGLMSARGAADFLTRTTTILATLFVTLSIGLAALAISNRAPAKLDTSLVKTPAALPAQAPPATTIPMAGSAPGGPVVPDDVVQATPVPLAAAPVADKKVVSKVEVKKDVAKPLVRDAKPEAVKVTPPPIAAPTPAVAPPATGNSAQ